MSTPGTPNPDPYAAYGGGVAGKNPAASPSPDPYSQYGGKVASAAPAMAVSHQPTNFGPDGLSAGVDDMGNPIGQDPSGTIGGGMARGAVKSFLQPSATISHLIHKAGEALHPGLGEEMIPQEGIDAYDKATTLHGGAEDAGAGLETIAEFALGEEALKGLSVGQKLSKIAPLVQTMEKYPKLAKVLTTALRQGSISAGQGMAHGEDAGTAAKQGLETGGIGLALGGAGAGLKKLLTPAEAVPSAAAEYGNVARSAIQPHLEELAHAGGDAIENFNVDDALAKTGDFTGAQETLKNSLNKVNGYLDQVTGEKYSPLKDEVTEARNAAWRGGEKEAAAYAEKQKEMYDLLNRVGSETKQGYGVGDITGPTGQVNPELIKAVQRGWQKYYALGDVVSMEKTGINGRKLLQNLNNSVRLNGGRDAVNAALGGPQRLEALEDIARKNMTVAGRLEFNKAIRQVAMHVGSAAGAAAGWNLGGNYMSAAGGMAAGRVLSEATLNAAGRVFSAVKVNPKIAQHLIFAIDSGARPEVYGPMIAAMVQQHEQQKQQPEEKTQSEDEQ